MGQQQSIQSTVAFGKKNRRTGARKRRTGARKRRNKKSADPVPANVVNAALYRRIRNRMRAEHKRKGKRWGAYSSGQLVQAYKRKGGKYRGRKPSARFGKKAKKKSGGLARWYSEKWIDVCTGKPCGRKKTGRGASRKFPYCRPSRRVSSSTPKLAKQLTAAQKKKYCAQKRRGKGRTTVRRA